MKIYFIKSETEYGPFFSTREKVFTYLRAEQDWDDEVSEEELAEIEAGTSPYTSVEEVELDDESVNYDG